MENKMDEGTSLGEWMKISILGSGSFGIVSQWRHKVTNDCVAIKKCRWDNPRTIPAKQRERWTQEVDFMKNVRHANIVGFKQLPADFLQQLERYNLSRLPLLTMEYCGGGNLRTCLQQRRHACGLREPDVRRVLEDIAAAVSHLHRCAITHRDIKPENVVLQPAAGGRVVYKLIDLGYAKDMNNLMSFVGTMAYTAPEIFKNEPYSHNVDYWSFGIMAYEVCCGKHPFIPKVAPVARFELIAKKGPRDICIHQPTSNKTIYTDKIDEYNHLSPCLRTHLEDWLGTMLEYDSAKRGRTQHNLNVFAALKSILDKQILHIFDVYNYTNYHYEINAGLKLHHLQEFIEGRSGIASPDQLLLTSNLTSKDIYQALNSPNTNATLLSDLGLSSQTKIFVLKRNEFVQNAKKVLPPAVKNLLNTRVIEITWSHLSAQTAHAVHFIEGETKKMDMIGQVVTAMFEYLKVILAQADLFSELKDARQRALHVVEFCKEMNVGGCYYDATKLAAIKKQMWIMRELMDNSNAAIARFLKVRTRIKLLEASLKRVEDWLLDKDINSSYNEALKVMSINNQKSADFSASGISRAILKCLKTQKDIQQEPIVIQHIDLSFKVLRECNKLTKWMTALTLQWQKTTNDLLLAQKQLTNCGNSLKTFSVNGTDASLASSFDTLTSLTNEREVTLTTSGHFVDEETTDLPPVDDLVKDFRLLRSRMQDVLSDLLSTYKSHATCVGDFVEYIDACADSSTSCAKITDV